MPAPARCLSICAAAVLVAAGLAACGGDDEAADATVVQVSGTMPEGGPGVDLSPILPTAGRDVVLIGDSITVASTPGLEAAVADLGVQLAIYAEVGRRITVGTSPEAGIDVMETVLDDGQPDLFVIALGTNDIGQYATQEEYEAVIDELLAAVPADAPIAWVNAYLRDDPEGSELFDDALIAALGARGNATVAKWSNIASESGMLSDGIHPSDEGTVEFADLVAGEIANCLD
jgi:lysophospholipase L1-like esterase